MQMLRYGSALAVLLLAACGGQDADRAGQAEGEQRPVLRAQAQPAGTAEQPAMGGAEEADAPVGAAAGPAGSAAGGPLADADGGAPAPRAASRRAEPPVADVTPQEAEAAADPTAREVLARAERAYEGLRSFQADFVQEVEVPLLGQSQRSRGTLSVQRPDRLSMRFSDPAGDLVVGDGRHLWLYYPSVDDDQVIRTTLAEGGQEIDLQREFLANATERFDVRGFGEGEAAGRGAYVLTLVPREPTFYRQVRVWIDRRDHLVRRFEVVEENRSVRRLELRDLRPNAALDDALFRFTPPPGATVFEQ